MHGDILLPLKRALTGKRQTFHEESPRHLHLLFLEIWAMNIGDIGDIGDFGEIIKQRGV